MSLSARHLLPAAALIASVAAAPFAQGQTPQQPGQAPQQQGPRRPTPPPVPQGATDVWNIDTSHTSAQFAVKHMLVSTVRGTLGPVVGWVRYDGKNLSSLAVNAVIDVTTINTGNGGRDRHLRSDDFLLVEQHPDITFVSNRVEGSPGNFKLVGDLTIRGVTREVALAVEGPSQPVQRSATGPQVIGASATTTINRKDFGVKYNALIEAGGAVVADEVKITIDIEARKR
ncbi:MAG: YceI family protein [Vicinamibacterales bacterium]